MKKIINTVLAGLGNQNSDETTQLSVNNQARIFTTADLWNVHRQGKIRAQRRIVFN